MSAQKLQKEAYPIKPSVLRVKTTIHNKNGKSEHAVSYDKVKVKVYQPSCNTRKFGNIKSTIEDWFYSHLKIWRSYKGHPNPSKERPVLKKFDTYSDLHESQ